MNEYGADKDLGEGYEAGEPFDESFDIPEYVQLIRDELNEVRAAISKINEEEYKFLFGKTAREVFKPRDPIEEIRYSASRQALWKEETRLQQALMDAEWILPPLMEPPHNMPTREKAKKMLHEGVANGRPLSAKQRGLFGIIASGKKPKVKS